MDNLLNIMSSLITNNTYFAPIIALIGGIIASFTPCNLAQIPLYLSIMNIRDNKENIENKENKENKKDIELNIRNTTFYCFGNLLTFIILGIVTAFVGRIFSANKFFYIFIGVLMILLFLDMNNIFSSNNKCRSALKYINKFNKKRSSAFILGIMSALFSSTCAMPILIATLSIISVNKNIIVGIISLIFYSLGNLALILVCSISLSVINKILNNEKYNRYNKIILNIYSLLILVIGLYMLYIGI